MEKLFGKNWKTTVASIFTAIGLVPQGIQSLQLETVPQELRIAGLICAFISFIYMGVMSKSKDVTGVGTEAETKKEKGL